MEETLETIYAKSDAELHQIIKAAGYDYDNDGIKTRLIATIIMNNDGRLHPIDKMYVTQPHFNDYYLQQNMADVAIRYGMKIPDGANIIEVLRLVIGYELIPSDAEDRPDDLVRDIYVMLINNEFDVEIYQEQEYGSQVTQALFYVLQFNNNSPSWMLYEEQFSDLEIQALVRGLSVNTGLKTLGLYNLQNVSNFGIQEFSRFLVRNDALTRLTLSEIILNEVNTRNLTDGLRRNRNIATLNLEDINFDPATSGILSDYLRETRTLKEFSTYRSTFNRDSFQNLIQFISDNDTLDNLIFGGNRGNFDFDSLATGLSRDSNLKQLELELMNSDVVNGDIEQLANSLMAHPTLFQLILIHANIGDRGAIALAKLLENNNVLTILNLRDDNIGDDGAIAIFTALQYNTKLESLNLENNRITPQGAARISELIENNHTLKSLRIHNPNIWQLNYDIERKVSNDEAREARRQRIMKQRVGLLTKPARRK